MKAKTVLEMASEGAASAPSGFMPWWRDKDKLERRLLQLIADGDSTFLECVIVALEDRGRRDPRLRTRIKAIRFQSRRGRPDSNKHAIFLYVEAVRKAFHVNQDDAFRHVGDRLGLSEHTVEKHYLDAKKVSKEP